MVETQSHADGEEGPVTDSSEHEGSRGTRTAAGPVLLAQETSMVQAHAVYCRAALRRLPPRGRLRGAGKRPSRPTGPDRRPLSIGRRRGDRRLDHLYGGTTPRLCSGLMEYEQFPVVSTPCDHKGR